MNTILSENMKNRTVIALLLCILCTALLIPHTAAEDTMVGALEELFSTADLMDATIPELLQAMEDGRLTSERLTQMYLDRIEAYDLPMGLRTIISLNPEALTEARNADQARANGAKGRLLGIPILVKDNIDIANMATTCGSYSLQYNIAAQDAEVIARLRAEGAVMLGKTNMSEFAYSGSNSVSSIGGMVGNAYDPSRTPAGSSGGSAVAVTCNFAAAALGTDTASSLRRPTSFANLYTLRSSFGMVSQGGLYRLNWDQDVIGPMCRTAEDVALLFDIISGTDDMDPYTAEADSYLPEGGYLSMLDEDGLRGKRIGYLANSFGEFCNPGTGELLQNPILPDHKITGMIERAKQTLLAGGAELIDLSEVLPEPYIASVAGNEEPYNMHAIREHVTQVLSENHIDAVIYVSQIDVAETQEDAIGKYDNFSTYINIFGPLGGLPEIMIPMGLADADPENGFPHALPLGLSMFSGYGKDAVLLQIAYAYEIQTDLRVQPWTTPALPDPALADFAQELLTRVEELDRAQYTEASLERIDKAASVLQALSMEQPSGSSKGSQVDAVTYQAAVRTLAEAYDEKTLLPPPTEAETTTVMTESEAPQEKTVTEWEHVLWLAPVLAAAGGTGGYLVYRRTKKKTRV